MRKRIIAVAGLLVAASCAGPALAAGDTAAGVKQAGLSAIGLTSDQRLVVFDVRRPAGVWSLGRVWGLSGDTRLVGIDFRVQNGKLYGVGDRGGIYTFSTRNAQAMKVSQLTVALSGTAFGVDFNPAANRLRVVSGSGQNLRHNMDDPAAPLATTVDATLTNPTTPPSTAIGVTGAAYTNNDLSTATATTLFDLDTMADRVSVQSPANTGTLAPAGSLGTDADPDAGFDIYYDPATGTNQGYAVIKTTGTSRLYRVNLLNGKATDSGAFPKKFQVTDLALPINQR
ncbi:DUF4394 domain-containing protein [Streptomyces sp. NBC_01451]|uniref:DUF4394 domain-containing protein n=1 Tax=Streptomyces sp. NBC_01451 TaxID=2903872 RepID=UPI002E311699|nr:DUF4394 domain-containing protein [Streptomyces sp. NBC_01451]